MAKGISGERIEKILLHDICNEIFLSSLTILFGIVVSALAFCTGNWGSISPAIQIFKLTFSPSSHSPLLQSTNLPP
jgi:hypothetical protein